MPKISEKPYDVPMEDGSYESQRIKINYNVDSNKFEMCIPERVAKCAGKAQKIARANEKELLKEFKKQCKEYASQLAVDPARFILIDYDMEVPGILEEQPRLEIQTGKERPYYRAEPNLIEMKIDYKFVQKRGKTWFADDDGERLDRWQLPDEKKDFLIPWSPEREAAVQRLKDDLVGFLFKIHHSFEAIKKDPDRLLAGHIVTAAARKTVPAPQPVKTEPEREDAPGNEKEISD